MNPAHFNDRSMENVLSTLVHEMVHLWQHRFGKPPRKAYHDKQWAAKMKEIGLPPSATGAPGGKETGQKMSHYIEEGGPFDKMCLQWLNANRGGVLYHDLAGDEEAKAKRKKKATSKTKYTCPDCDAAAWGKPNLHLICGDCECRMEPETQEEEK